MLNTLLEWRNSYILEIIQFSRFLKVLSCWIHRLVALFSFVFFALLCWARGPPLCFFACVYLPSHKERGLTNRPFHTSLSSSSQHFSIHTEKIEKERKILFFLIFSPWRVNKCTNVRRSWGGKRNSGCSLLIGPETLIVFFFKGLIENETFDKRFENLQQLGSFMKCQIWITAMWMPDGSFLCCLESPLDQSGLNEQRWWWWGV